MGCTKFFACALACALAGTAAAQAEDVRLVYPTDAAAAELDSSTPAKRVEPPVREDSEIDVVTPLGQIRAVLAALENVKATEEQQARDIAALKSADFGGLFPVVEKTAEQQQKLLAQVDGFAASLASQGAKIDSLAKMIEDIRATAEATQQTMASAERVTDKGQAIIADSYKILAIITFVLVCAYIVWRFGASIMQKAAARRDAYITKRAEEIAERERAKAAAAAAAAAAATTQGGAA